MIRGTGKVVNPDVVGQNRLMLFCLFLKLFLERKLGKDESLGKGKLGEGNLWI